MNDCDGKDRGVFVRIAMEKDAPEIASLLGNLVEFYHMAPDADTLRKGVGFALSNPDKVCFVVAEVDGRIAGIASVHFGHYSTFTNTWYGHLEDVYVAQWARRRGLGKALVEFAVELARARGLSRIDLEVFADNTPARRLYERLGFRTDGSLAYKLPFGHGMAFAGIHLRDRRYVAEGGMTFAGTERRKENQADCAQIEAGDPEPRGHQEDP